MRSVYIFVFRGVGLSESSPFKDEEALIKLGHAGFAFEERPKEIWGFHPTEQAVAAFENSTELLEYLRNRGELAANVHDDYGYFARAAELDHSGARTEVYWLAVSMEDAQVDVL
jgi:hypothetical protein